MISPFGQFVRTARLKVHLNLSEMASALSVSPSYLSAAEFGRRQVPSEWLPKIAKILNLDAEDVSALNKVAMQSNSRNRGVIEVSLDQLSPLQEEVALEFARKLRRLSDEDLQRIREHLIEEHIGERSWQRGSGTND